VELAAKCCNGTNRPAKEQYGEEFFQFIPKNNIGVNATDNMLFV